MSKSSHREAQMIRPLKQLEVGRKAEDVARELGISKHTIYAWKAKYGGMDVILAEDVWQWYVKKLALELNGIDVQLFHF
jgi:putative transposase